MAFRATKPIAVIHFPVACFAWIVEKMFYFYINTRTNTKQHYAKWPMPEGDLWQQARWINSFERKKDFYYT